MHLLGDMFFLWGFGLLVEGKLGWWRFLTLYLGIGVVQSIIIQAAMLGASGGGTPGSSGVIFGLMAISLVWAPKNEMSRALRFFRFHTSLNLPITAFAGIYLAWEIVGRDVYWLLDVERDVATCRLGDRGGSRGGNVETELG